MDLPPQRNQLLHCYLVSFPSHHTSRGRLTYAAIRARRHAPNPRGGAVAEAAGRAVENDVVAVEHLGSAEEVTVAGLWVAGDGALWRSGLRKGSAGALPLRRGAGYTDEQENIAKTHFEE